MSAALAYKDDWTEAAQSDPTRDRPRLYLAYSRSCDTDTSGDTRKKGQNLDFGYGWAVDYQSIQLRKNMLFGLDWNVTTNAAQFQICLRPGRKHKISITLPDGSMQRFSASNSPDCATAQVPAVNVVFTPEPGTTSTLTVAALPSYLVAQGGVLYDGDIGNTWNPTDFVLTTEDKYVYNIREGVGITSIVDPYGNTLTYGPNGIIHSNGQSVAFTRDALGRITKITDPMGKAINYTYDVNGNLSAVTNRNAETGSFAYNRDHGLTSYTDPAGTLQARYTYDAQGRLIAATDANGQTIQTNHDTANSQDIVTDRLGRKTTYAYDTNGNVTKIVDPTGAVTAYGYDALGNETQVTDPLGNVTQKTFDPVTFNQTSETDPLGHTMTITFDTVNKTQLNSFTDANGNVTSYTNYTYAQNITGPLNSYTHLGFSKSGDLSNLVSAGQSFSFAYDAKGNAISTTDAAGNVTSYTYDANGNQLTRTQQRTDAAGAKISITTSKSYDAEGRVTAETDELGGVTRVTYNSAGEPTSVTDPNGNVTRYTYDAQARLVKTTYPDGTSVTVTLDAEGNQVATTDRAGRTTEYVYDAYNQLIKTMYPDGTADTITYDANGLVVATHDAAGNPVRNTYDASGQLLSSADAQGQTTSYTYDNNGNLLTETDPMGGIVSYTYDALNRLTKTTFPDGTTQTGIYLSNGLKGADTDQNNNTVAYGYDALGRINLVTLTLAVTGATAVTSYAYDAVGNRVAQTDALGRTTKWGYDNARHVTSHALPNGETESFTYDAMGSRTSHTDFAGKKTSYTYDVNGRVVFATDSTGRTTGYLYTASGQVARTSDARGVTKYSYGALDRLTRQDNPDGTYLAYAYDANGNITQRSTPAGTVNYAYDSLNRLTTVTNTDPSTSSGQAVTRYTYDANGNRIKTVLPNGTETRYTYDPLNRLTGIEHRTTATQAVIRGYAYTLKPNGQRSQVREYDATGALRTKAYTYDTLNRLTGDVLTDARTSANSKTTTYAYGNTGNRTSKTEVQGTTTTTTTYAYDADDRLTIETQTLGATTSITTYAWDASGNLIQKTEPNQTTLYTWDSHNRLASVSRGASAATATMAAIYQYDANGYRIGKTLADGTQIAYLVDGNHAYAQVAMETSISPAGAKAETDYLYGLERIRMTRAGQGAYYHGDGLGSTRLLTDQAGTVTDSYDYDDYGALQSQTGTTRNDFLYAGEQFDSDANLYYNRARYLDMNIGRFTGMDPFGGEQANPITLNKYAYANSDPVNGKDPSGLVSLSENAAANKIAGELASMVKDNIMGMAMDHISNSLLGPLLDAVQRQAVKDNVSQHTMNLGNAGVATALTAFAVVCRVHPGKCLLKKIPTVVSGKQTRYTTRHIFDSLMGTGNGTYDGVQRPMPFLLVKHVLSDRLGEVPPTIRNASDACKRRRSGQQCDEYPYAAVIEGGEGNYFDGNVSLKLVSGSDNGSQGARMRAFYAGADIGPLHPFVNLALPGSPGFYIVPTRGKNATIRNFGPRN